MRRAFLLFSLKLRSCSGKSIPFDGCCTTVNFSYIIYILQTTRKTWPQRCARNKFSKPHFGFRRRFRYMFFSIWNEHFCSYIGIYTVSHFNQRMGIFLKVSILEKNFPYKSCRVQRGRTYGDLDLDLKIKDQGHFNVKLIFLNKNLIFDYGNRKSI